MKVFLIVAAILLFLLFMPLTLQISYLKEVQVRAGIFYPFLTVFATGRPKKEKKKKEKPQKEKAPIDKRLLWDLIKRIPGHMRRLLTVTKLKLRVSVGHEDPGDLALIYGSANAVLDTAAAALAPIYPREKWDVAILADFDSTQTTVEGIARAYTNLWRIIYVLISLLFCGILSLSKSEGVEKNG